MSSNSDKSADAVEQEVDMVPRTVPELFWRLAFFVFGVVFAGVVGL